TMLTSDVLQQFFAVYALLMALRMWFPVAMTIKNGLLNKLRLQIAGGVIGSISALVGIGGGTLVVPYLVMARQSMQSAIGTAAACGLPISIAAVAGYMIFGQPDQTLNGTWQTGFVHWPAFWGIVSTSIIVAPMGALLAKRLPINRLRRLFALVLLMVALYLFIS
ncbi:MAG: sulfite exporter TauE/SafE family protein, partial [Gammaproteobacteria bacterium]|nr:sulfite exporter TauE/SafE family protein [Gammaproteobacteria bacterium]